MPTNDSLTGMNNDNENTEFTGGKINAGFGGLGTPSEDDVQRRARELAVIDGLTEDDVDDRHLAQAYAELHGVDVPAEDVAEPVEDATEWDEVPGSAGRHVPNVGPGDEASIAERLVEEGLSEAQHDQMLRGTRELSKDDDLSEPAA
jgi:hypothetical protein